MRSVSKTIHSFIFDFYNTLSSERYFMPLGEDALAVIDDLLFHANSQEWVNPWMRGEISSRDIATYLSEHLPHSPDTILDALYEGCANLTFNPAVYAFAQQCRAAGNKTALVTGNMDVFSEVVVPAHGLDTVFDVVLNTADFGTLDKRVLWQKAFDAFGAGYGYASSLLIEDSANQTALFDSLGGQIHHYKNDVRFLEWLRKISSPSPRDSEL